MQSLFGHLMTFTGSRNESQDVLGDYYSVVQEKLTQRAWIAPALYISKIFRPDPTFGPQEMIQSESLGYPTW